MQMRPLIRISRQHFAAAFALILALAALMPPASFAEDTPQQPKSPVKQSAPKERHELFDRVLELNQVQEPELKADEMRKAFDDLITATRVEVEKAATPREKIRALNKMLLDERDVSYLSNVYWRDATLAASLLRKHGNCLSTSTLYMVVGEALNLPIHMVLIPRHAFARWDDGKEKINIETTNKGFEMSDKEYLRNADQPSDDDIDKLGWCKSLSGDEALAELHVTCANHRVGENKIEDALDHLDKALHLAPDRSDYALHKLTILASIPGKRDSARRQIQRLTEERYRRALPPSVVTHAFTFLAEDAAGGGDHEKEREYLMAAFVQAPKPMQQSVLSQLAFCLRALKDYHGAVRYMELAATLFPDDSSYYNLAILQKNEGNLKGSLETIDKALALNPESWNLQILKAGYLIADGQKERGMELFETLERPRADEEFWEIMLAWFWAECKERDEFYLQFEHALETVKSPRIMEWVDQDPDLDFLREELRFQELILKHRARLMDKK